MVKAGLNGMTMPRRFGGLNFPITPYTMCAEIVAAADAGFGNIWSLQDCIETLYEFGNADQHSRFIPRVCQGETMSMDLTEPDAGSDLQAVMLKATYSEKDGCWLLNGVKRFITNGDADIHLVLARSEEGTRDGRGLSMFIYDKRQGGVDVRRIEHKLGIHGSPTCELVYKNAKAELCGDRKLGLIKYVMALMNGARLGIAAQSVGLSQAAYNEGLAYAKDRKQFGKAIIDFPAVYDMLAIMKGKLDAGRALLYQTARYVDIYKALDDISRERKLTPEERQEQKKYAKLADSCTYTGHPATNLTTHEAPIPNTTPINPPVTLIRIASIRNWARISRPFAPIDILSPISRVRSVTDTYMMFIIPIPPTSKEIPAIHANNIVIMSVVEFIIELSSCWERMLKSSSSDSFSL